MTNDTVQWITRQALDGLYQRQAATSHNIANSGTPGFGPMRVDFETTLREVILHAGKSLTNVPPTVRIWNESTAVTLDSELTTAAETSMRYAALLESMDRLLAIESMAIRGE